jgi:hypothetical protein
MFADDNNNDKPRYVPTDHPGLVRDTETYAVLSTDLQALMNHRKKTEHFKKTEAKLDSINNVKEELDTLKNDMTDIKELLQKLLVSKE